CRIRRCGLWPRRLSGAADRRKVKAHMRRFLAVGALLLLFVTAHASQRQAVPASVDLVELDFAVLDGHEKPVTGLTAHDFVVKEDGAPREIQTFLEVQPTTRNAPDNAGPVVLIPDDVAVPAAATQAIRI